MDYCNQWFHVGEKLGRLFTLWRSSQHRLGLDQNKINEIETQFKELRRKVMNNQVPKDHLNVFANQVVNLETTVMSLFPS